MRSSFKILFNIYSTTYYESYANPICLVKIFNRTSISRILKLEKLKFSNCKNFILSKSSNKNDLKNKTILNNSNSWKKKIISNNKL